MGNGDREGAILAALGDPSTLVRERAIALAARHLSPEALGALLGNGENAVLRNSAFSALERQGPYAVPHLLKLTVDGDSEVAMFSVQILSLINDSSASRALLPLLDHPDRNIAQSAIEALGNVQAVEAVPALIRLLNADLWLQFAAVVALGKLGDPRAVRPLLELCSHEVLAEPAIEALGRIGSPEALRPLVELLYANDRIPQRDQVLRAVAATLERNPPGPAAGQPGAGRADRSGREERPHRLAARPARLRRRRAGAGRRHRGGAPAAVGADAPGAPAQRRSGGGALDGGLLPPLPQADPAAPARAAAQRGPARAAGRPGLRGSSTAGR